MEINQNKELIIYTDGAVRGNPGKAGVGVIIKDKNGRVVKRLRKFIGNTTNNVAEYTGLILALNEAKELKAESITIYSDSELMVNQIKGIYRIKDKKLSILKKKVDKLLNVFKIEGINFIPREENKEADKLANSAIDLKVDQMVAGI